MRLTCTRCYVWFWFCFCFCPPALYSVVFFKANCDSSSWLHNPSVGGDLRSSLGMIIKKFTQISTAIRPLHLFLQNREESKRGLRILLNTVIKAATTNPLRWESEPKPILDLTQQSHFTNTKDASHSSAGKTDLSKVTQQDLVRAGAQVPTKPLQITREEPRPTQSITRTQKRLKFPHNCEKSAYIHPEVLVTHQGDNRFKDSGVSESSMPRVESKVGKKPYLILEKF